MTEQEGKYYTAERWGNWLERLEEEDIDPEDEDSARLLLNLQDDAAIAVAKILADYDDDTLGQDETAAELERVRDIVLAETELEDEEKEMLVDGVQTSLVCVFYAAEEYVHAGAAEDATVSEYVHAAADAEANEDMDAALGYLVQAGTRIIDPDADDELDVAMVEELEYGLVSEWVNGLDSLQAALEDPEVVEEDAAED
jgi:hypothetical protein